MDVIDRVERLYQAGHLFLTLDAKFDRDAMVREIAASIAATVGCPYARGICWMLGLGESYITAGTRTCRT